MFLDLFLSELFPLQWAKWYLVKQIRLMLAKQGDFKHNSMNITFIFSNNLAMLKQRVNFILAIKLFLFA
jgi:hypothetical protein